MPDRSSHPDLEARAADASLGKLRTLRVYAQRDLSLASLADTARRYQRDSKRLAGACAAWEAACPPDLLSRTSIVALARGVLTVGVDGASTRYALDRALRDGGLDALRRASSAAISKVKMVESPSLRA
ncbi:MAG: DUF721 domain-containing protein [Phycisphaeraceae bacterium]|nr:DUF721 domain-containing protein [Phycisphaeraceae bacterium]